LYAELFKEAGADTDTATTMALDMLFAGIQIIIFCEFSNFQINLKGA
jgi:hypothetical protein